MCHQKHSQATQTEGHHVRSHLHSLHFFWTVSFSSRTFHVNPGADHFPLSSCLLWLYTVWISAFRSSVFFITIISDVLWMDICLFYLFPLFEVVLRFLPLHVWAAASVSGAGWGLLQLHRATRTDTPGSQERRNISLTHQFSHERFKAVIRWFEEMFSSQFKVELKFKLTCYHLPWCRTACRTSYYLRTLTQVVFFYTELAINHDWLHLSAVLVPH